MHGCAVVLTCLLGCLLVCLCARVSAYGGVRLHMRALGLRAFMGLLVLACICILCLYTSVKYISL